MQAACNFLADPNLTGTDLLDAMSQAADVLLGNASTAIVGCLDTSGFNNPTFSLISGNVAAWEYQVGLAVASAAYHMNAPSCMLPIASSQAAVNITSKHGIRHSSINGQIFIPASSLRVSWPCVLGCLVLQVCTQLVQPLSYDGGEPIIHDVPHRYSCLQHILQDVLAPVSPHRYEGL